MVDDRATASGQDVMPLELRNESLTSDVAFALITALNEELAETYPEEGANHFRLDNNEVAPGVGAFLVAYSDGEAVACGAVRKLDPQTAEIKRMYVTPKARGAGISRQVLDALEQEAVKLGVSELVLETGTRQTAATALYERGGFRATPLFGEYIGSPLSVCYGKRIGQLS